MSITLYYHEGKRGFAEKIRILLADAGLKFNDVGVDSETFERMKSDGTLNWGVLPALEHDGKFIEQSTNILEYVAGLADAQGKGAGGNKYLGAPGEAPFHRAIALAVHDFQQQAKTYAGKDATPSNFFSEILPTWFKYFTAVLDKNDDGDVRTEEYCYGKHFTYADVAVFEAVNAVIEIHGTGKLRPFPKLKEFHDKVAGRPRIEHHIATRNSGY